MIGRVASLLCVAGLVAALAACGGTSTTTTTNAAGQTVVSCHTSLAKTKFVLHAGLALVAFDRYIYKPWRAGSFKSGAPGRAKALAKAAATAAVVYHELSVAAGDARCDGPILHKLAAPFTSAASEFTKLKGSLGGGDLSGIAGAATLISSLKAEAAKNGISVG